MLQAVEYQLFHLKVFLEPLVWNYKRKFYYIFFNSKKNNKNIVKNNEKQKEKV